MRVRLRARINGRLPDPDGKFRDEVTQEIEIEIDGKDFDILGLENPLSSLIATAEAELDAGIIRAMGKLQAFGGLFYRLPLPPVPKEYTCQDCVKCESCLESPDGDKFGDDCSGFVLKEVAKSA